MVIGTLAPSKQGGPLSYHKVVSHWGLIPLCEDLNLI